MGNPLEPRQDQQLLKPITTEVPVVDTAQQVMPTAPIQAADVLSSDTTLAVASVGEVPQASNRATQLRSLLLKSLLACLVVAAVVAVVAILAGSMGQTAWYAIFTVLSAMIHIGILFAVISMTASGNSAMVRTTNFVINSAMVIAILSFFTSVFGIWEILDGEISAKLYLTYAVAMFVILHAKTLMGVEAVYAKVRPYMYANFVLMGIVALLILGVVYTPDGLELLAGFYGRLLAASAIVDATLSIIIATMHRLHLQKHPEIQTASSVKSGGSAARIIGGLVLFVFVIWPLFAFLVAVSNW